ncbi:MAG TPA: TCR/Tet family MFS transporter [Saprospiraceae bacterium]|nr:TCR/Tet family MFS transporter [Saprospiraceae bacterium]HPI08301.1 TCR/Tet family MFS transporter [Saprospiraceae bacterium]
MIKNRQAAVGFIFVTLLIDVIGFGIIIPVIPKLITHLTGDTLSHASRVGGWLMFAYALMQFICAPILGGLSDRYGRRPILLLSLFGFGVDYIFQAYAPTIAWLFVGRILAGILGSSFTTASAYIADVSTPEKRAQNFGLVGAAFGMGFIIGPAIGGLLGQYGPRAPFLAAAALALLNWLYGLLILPESLDPENRRAFSWKRANPVGTLLQLRKYPVIIGMVGSLVLLYIAAQAVQGAWSYYTMEKFQWDERMVGISLSFVGLITAIVQAGLIRIIIPKLGQERGVYVGLGLYSLGFLLFAFATEGWMMFAFLIPYCLGGIAGPSLQGLISNQVPANVQGELQGGLTSLMSVTSIIGPVLMTGIFSYFTSPGAPIYFPGAAMLTGSFLTIISTLLAYRNLHRKKPH